MRFLFLILLTSGTLFSSLSAQNYTIKLLTGDYNYQPNFGEFLSGPLPTADEQFQGRYYRVIQFFETPTAQERQALEATGLQILDYLPNYAYVVSLPLNYNRAQLQQRNIRAVFSFDQSQKISPTLLDRPLPEHATPVEGFVDVEMVLYKDVHYMNVQATLHQLPIEELPRNHRGALTYRVDPDDVPQLANLPFVAWVEAVSPSEPENQTARTLVRSNNINSDHALGRKYDGSGVVVALGDDGIIGPHIDYNGRIDQSNVNQNDGDHGDHVGGTIMGAGNLNPLHRGMATGADMMVYEEWDNVNDAPNAFVNDGVVITSTSYSNGCNAGYTSFARSVDTDTRQNPHILHIFSAGNSGTSNCGYGAGSNWGNVTGGVKIGKNVIAVANLNETSGLETSSSRGPAHDGRIKPEISAKGTNVISTVDVNSYESKTGTSMSCPGVSGVTAQLYHAYRTLNNGDNPPSALIKGILLNSADDIDNAGPDFKTGFGQMNALRAVETLENQTYGGDAIGQGGSNSVQITVPSGVALMKVMVYWHDYEASVNASTALVNDLDITLSDGQTTWQPWVLDHTPSPALLNALPTRARDSVNNMEQITLEAPAAGTYTLNISGHNVPQGPQDYYYVYEFRDSVPRLSYPNGGETFNPGESEMIRWEAEGNYGSWTLEYSLDAGNNWFILVSGLNGSRRYWEWSIPNQPTGQLRVRVSRNGISDMGDHDASIFRVPSNLGIEGACPTYVNLVWDSMPGATDYDVYMLGSKYMDSVGTTTTTTFQVNGVSSTANSWFAVRARGANGEVSRRSIAIEYTPGVFNCSEPNDPGISMVTAPGSGILQNCLDNLNSMPVTVSLVNYSPNALSNLDLNYQLNNGTVITESFAGPLMGYDTIQYTFNNTADFSGLGQYTLNAWVSFGADVHLNNDTATALIQTENSLTVPLPYEQTFDTWLNCSTAGDCEAVNCNLTNGWSQGDNFFMDDFDFRTDNGGTPSNGTGPSLDHTQGNALGRYIYTEATSCFNKMGEVVTPCIDLDGAVSPELVFYYHMQGANQGNLHVDLFANNQWNLDVTQPISGASVDFWWRVGQDISPYVGGKVLVRFRAETGDGFRSDLALDDVGVQDLFVSNTDPAGDLGLQIYPNPTDGQFRYVIRGLGAQTAAVRIFDAQGRIIREVTEVSVGDNLIGALDLSQAGAGLYFIQVESAGQVWSKRIVVE